MIDKTLLKTLAENNRISLDDTALDRFDAYAEKLVSWNEKINLTAITDPTEIVYKHFLDSLMPLKFVDFPEGSTLIDVGTGAGFPGLCLQIARPDLNITLLDSLQKRLDVLEDISNTLGISPNLVHARAEDGGHDANLREQFDFATARAVANLRELSEYCLPFVNVGGAFLALKGPAIKDELRDARNAIEVLGGAPDTLVAYGLDPDGERGEHHLLLIHKETPTPSPYPRKPNQIKKKPL